LTTQHSRSVRCDAPVSAGLSGFVFTEYRGLISRGKYFNSPRSGGEHGEAKGEIDFGC